MRHPVMTVSPEFVGLLHSLYRKQYGGSPQKLKTELPLSSFIGERLSPARLPLLWMLAVSSWWAQATCTFCLANYRFRASHNPLRINNSLELRKALCLQLQFYYKGYNLASAER